VPRPGRAWSLRDGRRRRLHPEAAHDRLREKVAEDSRRLASHGWRYPFGYVVHLYRPDGSVGHRSAKTYAEATDERDEAMRSGDYEKAWIVMLSA
jgi:hypothetical protein